MFSLVAYMENNQLKYLLVKTINLHKYCSLAIIAIRKYDCIRQSRQALAQATCKVSTKEKPNDEISVA